mmetsp:Transcript_3102/g.4443  ORF Transcript_3102/g.4443 Transcript_3102/m.4443 type:complete len:131 (+) Transcript_3102:589-981(+)
MNKKSLESVVTSWKAELADWPLSECLMLVGNKIDLLENDEGDEGVSLEEHNAAAKKLMARGSIRTSAKTGENVSESFMRLVFLVHEQEKARSKDPTGDGQQEKYDSTISLNFLRNSLDNNLGEQENPCCS